MCSAAHVEGDCARREALFDELRALAKAIPGVAAVLGMLADSDEVARAIRDDVARCSGTISPGVPR